MRMLQRLPVFASLLLAMPTLVRASTPICSTEKINSTCYVFIDRTVPIAMPTYQMKPGNSIIVTVLNPFHFETLTLDPQSLQAFPGTDQAGALITSALPDVKGLTASSHIVPFLFERHVFVPPDTSTKVGKDIADLQKRFTNALSAIPAIVIRLNTFAENASIIYAQLKEIESSVPRPLTSAVPPGPPKRLQKVPDGPTPWSDYAQWRLLLLCELQGGQDCSQSGASFSNVTQEANDLIAGLPTLTSGAYGVPTTTTHINLADFDKALSKASDDVSKMANSALKDQYQVAIDDLKRQSQLFYQRFYLYSSNLTKVNTDLQSFETNIALWKGDPAQTGITKSPDSREQLELGVIADPKSSLPAAAPARMLGRQIVYSINSDNQVANLALSVPTTTQKVSIVTITAIYADPRFEMAAGSIISFQHNRSFANAVAVQPPPGSSLNKGDTYISETRTRPEVIPMVTGNYRITNEFDWGGGRRRKAVYATAWVGLNPYNALPEFGAGPTFSYRSIMFSGLYHRSHDVKLLQGEYPGMVWCNVYGTTPGTPTTSGTGVSCTPPAPAPATQTFWTNAFGIGVAIRIPTSFTAGTGGVSR
jgi:hypothetical protein